MANLGSTIINGMLRVNGKLSVSDAIIAPSFEGTATKAKQDGDGKVISSTYLKLAGGTLTGNLYLNGVTSSGVTSTSRIIFGNTSTQYANIAANSNSGIVFNKDLSSNTASMGYAGAENAFRPIGDNTTATLGTASYKWANVFATTFTGNLSGTATKATQDGSGNVITSTYLKNTGGTVTHPNYTAFTLKRNASGSGSGITYSNTSGTLATMGFNGDGSFCMTKGGGTLGTADMLKITSAGIMTTYGNITPSVNNAASIGSSSMKYANVYATTFTGALSGNASTASKAAQLTTARNINGVSFNGTANININKLVCIDVTGETIDWNTYNYANGYTEGIWNSKTDGGANAFTNLAVKGKSCRIELKLCRFNNTTDYIQMQEQWVGSEKKLYRRYNVSGTWGSWVTVSEDGVAVKAMQLKTARTIGLSGVTATAQSFDGSKNIVIPITAVPASLITGTVAAATKATQDGNGSTISSTYLKLSGGTVTGDLRLGGTQTAVLDNNSKIIFSNGSTDYSNISANNTGAIGFYISDTDKTKSVAWVPSEPAFRPENDNELYLGASGKRWKNVYAVQVNGRTPTGSSDGTVINVCAMSSSTFSSSSSSLPNGTLVAVY